MAELEFAELKIRCSQPGVLKQLINEAIEQKVRQLLDSLNLTEERLKQFESKYQISTNEFLHKLENDELEHRMDLEFDEWVGESWIKDRLLEDLQHLREVEFAN